MRRIRKIVDERQEQEMLRVERSAFWMLYIGLAVVITVQLAAFGADLRQVAGECVVLGVGAVWSVAGYLRQGAWGYFSRPGYKSYLICSAVAALLTGLVVPISRCFRYGRLLLPREFLLLYAFQFIHQFLLYFVVLFLLGSVTKRRQKKLQREYDEEL